MVLQNLRSNTASKRPLASGLSDGQIAVNTNETSPGLFFKGAGGAVLKVGPVHIGNSAPNSSPAAGGSTGNSVGEQWLDTSNSGFVFKIWDGTDWRSETGEFVDVAGDTMTGNLTISGADLIMSNGEIVAETGSAATPSITFTGDLDTGFYKPAANELAISTGGTGRVFINSSGNVGIGTSSPGALFEVGPANSSIQLTGADLKFTRSTAYFQHLGTGSFIFRDKDNSNNYITFDYNGGNNRLAFGSKDYTIFNTGSSFTEAMRIDSNGNVGIGTSSPLSRLHVKVDGTSTTLQRWQADLGTNDRAIVLNSPTSDSATEPFTFETSNSIAFQIDAAEAVRIDSNGRVGIGTDSPILAPVHVNQGSNGFSLNLQQGSTANPKILFTTTAGTTGGTVIEGAPDTTSGFLAFSTGNSESMRITSNGNVGIGTTAPDTTLDVRGNIRFGTKDASNCSVEIGQGATGDRNAFIDLTGDTTYTDFGLRVVRTDGGANGSSQIVHRGTGSLEFLCLEAGSTKFSTSNSEKARIDSGGRLLVGTSSARANFFNASADAILQVEGTTGESSSISVVRNTNNAGAGRFVFGKTRSASVGGNTIVQNGDDLGFLTFQGSDGTEFVEAALIKAQVDGTPGANDMPGRLVFSTTADGASGPTERMRIRSNGVININTGGTDVNVGQNSIDGITIYTANPAAGNMQLSNNGGPCFYLKRRSSDGIIIDIRRDTTSVGNISVTTSSTAYNTSSDYRLKENVVPLANAADRVNQLQVHRFNFIADPNTTVDGFLAHEAQAVVPECVTGTKDEVDDEGNPVYQGIDQSKIVPLLTAALQEALAKIETLEQRLSDAGL